MRKLYQVIDSILIMENKVADTEYGEIKKQYIIFTTNGRYAVVGFDTLVSQEAMVDAVERWTGLTVDTGGQAMWLDMVRLYLGKARTILFYREPFPCHIKAND